MMRSSDLARVSIKRCLATPWAVPSFVKIDLLKAAQNYLRFLKILSIVETLITLPSFFKDSTSLPSPSGA